VVNVGNNSNVSDFTSFHNPSKSAKNDVLILLRPQRYGLFKDLPTVF